MATDQDDNLDPDFISVESDYPERDDGKPGPPDDWKRPSWFDYSRSEWWYRFPDGWREDPCPVKAVGHIADEYVFVTGARAVRRFTAGKLHGVGGPNDLFAGDLGWPKRHFRRYDVEKGEYTGGLMKMALMGAMIAACIREGWYDNAAPHRSVGTWREDGLPIIHAGDVILHNGRVLEPGDTIGCYRYVIGARRELPALELSEDGKSYKLKPGSLADCHRIAARIDEWHWVDEEGRDLFLGGLCCDMLGDALHWKPHRFIRAQAGAGKTALLRYMEALLGAAAHPVQRNFTRARLEQKFSNTSCALLLDEMKSEADGDKLRRVFELIRLLSDDGATGGRGSSSGHARDIDLHGTVTMVATLAEAWRPQDRSRIAYIELKRLRDRPDFEFRSPQQMDAVNAEAAEMSSRVRARIFDRFPLFLENLAKARARILELGGSPRDADQLGYLIAGWAIMTGDEVMDEDTVGKLDRFTPYIMTVTEEADGSDDPSECFYTLMGLASGVFKSGRELTVGQAVALARHSDAGADMREALRGIGLIVTRLTSQIDGRVESWPEAWLAVANGHPRLEKLLSDYSHYRTPKRAQILSGLHRMVDGVPHEAKPSKGNLKFGGKPSRAWLIPPIFLPELEDDHE